MRHWSLVTLSLLSACSFRVPRGIPVRVAGKATIRADVRVQAQGTVRRDTALVALQGAPVTEFFGIPLADATDVLFVLDVSGSMSARAEGQIAMLPPPPSPPAELPGPPPDATTGAPPPVTPPPAAGPPASSAPPPPSAPPPTAPPPMGYPPGYPPPSSVPPAAQPAPAQPAVTVPTKLEVAQSELIDAIGKLPAGTRLNVLVFSDDVDAYAPAIVTLDEPRRADLVAFVREMQADGATALQPAMRLGFLLNAPRIVLLSDGLGNVGLGPEDLLRDLREAMRGGVRVDTIGIGPGQDGQLLSTIAAESGGLYQRL